MKTTDRFSLCVVLIISGMLMSCSSTKNIPEDDQLFVGLTKIEYKDYEKNEHFLAVQEEVEAALATAPNGALFGSSYHRSPFPYGLWIWNAFSKSRSVFSKWMTKSFGKPPVLMSRVNPELRAKVANELLRSNGYFDSNVEYDVITQKNPKKAKIGYTVSLGNLYRIDSLRYVNFPPRADSLIRSSLGETLIHPGDPFKVSVLDAERTRLSNVFRNNGYYYYQPGYASYLADTVSVADTVQLRLQFADSVPDGVRRKWYIGKVNLELRKDFMETLSDSLVHRYFTVRFNGRKPPLRTRVILRDLKLRPRRLYSHDDYLQSASKITGTGLFSFVDFKFTPRDTTLSCDTLDMTLSCVFDKPYDFYVEANMVGKTSGKLGPGAVIGISRRNAFRGGEKLDININGSYEWQTGHNADGSSSEMNSYEYGANVSLELPRLVLPFWRRVRWYNTPSTILKASSSVINRSGYFKRHIVSGELTYNFQRTATSVHQFSPLILQYEYMTHMTEAFGDVMNENPYLLVTMADQFVPKMRYSYTYSSPATYRNPIYWQVVVSEASNLLSLGYLAAGKKWNSKYKQMFKNPYAQFFKIETDFSKTWAVGDHSQLVGHVSTGLIWSYGNSESAPYSEQFYVGGANSIRAFNVRSIGPGAYHTDSERTSYMDQTGDFKLQANLEYRFRLFGNLYGATFLDAGNVWALRDDGYRTNSLFKVKNLLKETALGTGVGLRYDLEFFVLRLDWGVGLHVPYKSGFYNISSFRDGQSLHFAIGYPF
ncbi:BamA/TamA family outer membrane protein [Leyella lascolaii]|uniref:BamA/TamA family outer membrane protein n=1 Tax=Leyella lascolaii TaxID=1776379 RepID=A0AAW7JLC3_9BACT|nr:BamA/TamA family outer membrane protein [Leyella lascolaii]MDN0023232.1 BamA/TamA family outer membrane protein [Leyella lascolaii]MDN0025108.1 BamA/TamA family outer membrane protein [Leyella lascolaii]